MKQTLFILLVLSLAAASCKNRHKVAKAEENMETLSSEGSDSTVVNDAFSDLEDDFDFDTDTVEKIAEEAAIFAYLERGACFGHCPTYKVQIFESGKAEYHGIKNVPRLGFHKASFTKEEMMALSAAAMKFGLDTMALEYDNRHVTDLPSSFIGVTINENYKQIKMRHGYPQSLRDFRDYFEELLKSKDWIVVRPPENKE